MKRFILFLALLFVCYCSSCQTSQQEHSEEVVWEFYSNDLFEKYLKEGRVVYVLLRSEYSLFDFGLIDKNNIDTQVDPESSVFLDLKWDWNNPGFAKKLFKSVGFTKEAFVVAFTKGGKPRICWPPNSDEGWPKLGTPELELITESK